MDNTQYFTRKNKVRDSYNNNNNSNKIIIIIIIEAMNFEDFINSVGKFEEFIFQAKATA